MMGSGSGVVMATESQWKNLGKKLSRCHIDSIMSERLLW